MGTGCQESGKYARGGSSQYISAIGLDFSSVLFLFKGQGNLNSGVFKITAAGFNQEPVLILLF